MSEQKFKIGDKVTVRGYGYMYGVGTIVNIVQNKAVIQFSDGIAYIPLKDVAYVSYLQ